MSWSIEFYTDAGGGEPVREALDQLTSEQRAKVNRSFELLEDNGLRLKMPHARYLGDGLWELRTIFAGDIFRSLYFAWTSRTFVILHVFQKKTQKTPPGEIEAARRRRRDWLERHKVKP